MVANLLVLSVHMHISRTIDIFYYILLASQEKKKAKTGNHAIKKQNVRRKDKLPDKHQPRASYPTYIDLCPVEADYRSGDR